MTKDANAIVKSPSGRPERTPVGRRNVLSVKGKVAGFEYRIVNDEDDRVQQFKDAGWEIVSDSDVVVGDKRVSKTSSPSTMAMTSVGNGTKGIVMRIREDWYQEDQSRKLADVAELEATTRSNALNGSDYGEFTIDKRQR